MLAIRHVSWPKLSGTLGHSIPFQRPPPPLYLSLGSLLILSHHPPFSRLLRENLRLYKSTFARQAVRPFCFPPKPKKIIASTVTLFSFSLWYFLSARLDPVCPYTLSALISPPAAFSFLFYPLVRRLLPICFVSLSLLLLLLPSVFPFHPSDLFMCCGLCDKFWLFWTRFNPSAILLMQFVGILTTLRSLMFLLVLDSFLGIVSMYCLLCVALYVVHRALFLSSRFVHEKLRHCCMRCHSVSFDRLARRSFIAAARERNGQQEIKKRARET